MSGGSSSSFTSCVISEAFVLCRLPGKAIGVAPHVSKKDCILVTGDGFHVYNVRDQKCVQSWNAKPDTILSVSAVINKSGQFFGVRNGNSLFSWDSECKDVEQCESKSLGKKVFALKAASSVNGAVVVLEDGTISLMSSDLKQLCNSYEMPKKNLKLVDCTMYERKDRESVLLILVQDKKTKKVYLHSFQVSGNVKVLACYELTDLCSLKTTFTGISFSYVDMKLSVLGSDGNLYVYHVPSILTKGNFEIEKVTCLKVCSSASKASGIKHVVANESFFFACGAGTNLSEGSDSVSVCVRDLSFGTNQGARNLFNDLNVKSRSDMILEQKSSEITMVMHSQRDGVLVMLFGSTVAVCRVYCPEFKMAMAVGKGSGSNASVDSGNIFSACADFLATSENDLKNPEEVQSILSTENEKEMIVLEKLSSKKKITKSSEFMKVFMKHIGAANDDSMEVDDKKFPPVFPKDGVKEEDYVRMKRARRQAMKAARKSKKMAEVPSMSENFIRTVVKRIMSEQPGFARDALKIVLKSHSFSAVSSPGVLESLMDQNDFEMIHLFVNHVHDIPEKSLVSCISYFLKIYQQKDGKTMKLMEECRESIRTNANVSLTEDICGTLDPFFSSLLAVPRNDVFLVTQLARDLNISSLITFLEYLLIWVKRYADFGYKHIKKNFRVVENEKVLQFDHVLDWVALLLDAHYSTVVLVGGVEAHSLLAEMADTIVSHCRLCAKAEDLKGNIDYIVNSFKNSSLKNKANANPGAYCIEVISI
eukprot:Nk52_evm58s2039 gene=Nk52_evmTU58s2039